MSQPEPLSAALEDYLETIYHLVQKDHVARAKDIASGMNVHKSTVTNALKTLADRDMINYAPYGLITLTPDGEQAACDVIRRHNGLRDFFVKILAVEEAQADQAACQMEHAIPQEIMERFLEFVDFVEKNPDTAAGEFPQFHQRNKTASRKKRQSS